MASVESYVDAWRDTYAASLSLAGELAPEDWERRTGCPGWAVIDVYRHLIECEVSMVGTWRPAGVRGGPVLAMPSPSAPSAHLIERMTEVYELRCGQLSEMLAPIGAARDGAGAQPSAVVQRTMMMRAFDCWIHEQDIRVAVGRPGNLDTGGARVAHALFGGALANTVPARVSAARQSMVRFVVTGPLPLTADVRINGPVGAVPVDSLEEPTVRVATDWATFVQICSGRDVDVQPALRIDGDAELGRRVISALAVTP